MPERDTFGPLDPPPTVSQDADAPEGTVAQAPDQVAALAEADGGDCPVIPGYEIRRKLGEGGMGVVYLATQRGLNRDVAVKTLVGPTVSRATLARFWAEAEVMAEVQHPNVVRVIELGEFAGKPFMAMEFVKGGSLAHRLRGGVRLSPGDAADLIGQVARGVAAAHDLGIVHRDLKPDNVLLEGDTPKVADFGIAKRKAHEVTHTGAMMGTPAYMSPEQAASQSRHVGPAADVWSLGVMLYECLSGKRPFDGNTVFDVLAKIATEEPPALRTWLGSVPRDLETVVAKCLTKEPALRYASAKELADDLSRFTRGEPIAARPIGAAERVVRWVRRKPTAAAAYGLSALAVALALIVFVVFGFWREAENERATAEGAKKDAEAAKKGAEVARDGEKSARLRIEDLLGTETRLRGEADGARQNEEVAKQRAVDLAARLAVFEYGRTMQVAHQEWHDNNVAGARALLDTTSPHLRGWEWRYVHRLCNGSLRTLRTGGAVNSAAFGPDGARVVTAGGGSGIAQVWDVRTGAKLLTLEMRPGDAIPYTGSASFSPDGARVVTASHDETARVWDARTGAELLTLKGHTGFVSSAAFSPDGSRIVTASHDGTARVWDAKTGIEYLPIRGHTGFVRSVSFRVDGTQLITAGGEDRTARVWDTRTGSEIAALKGHTENVNAASFSPDGARVVTASDDETAKVWDARTGAEVSTFRGHQSLVYSASFSPDGARVVTASQDNHALVWDVMTGTQRLDLKGAAGAVHCAAFSSDGTRIVTAHFRNKAHVWDARTGGHLLVLSGHTGAVWSAAFSPDGAWIITSSGDGTARVWDARTGAEALTIKGHTAPVLSARFSPDATRIVTASADGTVKVWEARTGAEVLTLKGRRADVAAVAISPDGTRVATTIWERDARIYDSAPLDGAFRLLPVAPPPRPKP